MLKTNSRFTCLVDNMGPNRDPRPRRDMSRNKNAGLTTKSNSFQKKIGYEMDINNFPALSSTPNKNPNLNLNESYVENLTKPNKQENAVNSENLAPGWISTKGSVSFIHKNKNKNKPKRTIPPLEPRYIDMMNRINTNYVNYKEHYIEFWGEEEYERMFLFPNYNYLEYDDYTDDEDEDDEEEYDDEY